MDSFWGCFYDDEASVPYKELWRVKLGCRILMQVFSPLQYRKRSMAIGEWYISARSIGAVYIRQHQAFVYHSKELQKLTDVNLVYQASGIFLSGNWSLFPGSSTTRYKLAERVSC